MYQEDWRNLKRRGEKDEEEKEEREEENAEKEVKEKFDRRRICGKHCRDLHQFSYTAIMIPV